MFGSSASSRDTVRRALGGTAPAAAAPLAPVKPATAVGALPSARAVVGSSAATATVSAGSGSASAATSGVPRLATSSTAAAAGAGVVAAPVPPAVIMPPKREKLKFGLKDIALHATVGTGTFGRVRVVQYKPTRQWFAMKILKKSEIVRLRQVDHIRSEVKILSMINHPFIVNLIGNTHDDRRIYLLFEYVPGGELFSHLRREGRFTNDHARFYAAQITLAFEYLHSLNIVYRDLKPENLLLSAKGNMKVTDFGFAKIVEDRTYTLCGTPEYLAPEIIQSKGHNKSVDWWAVGILIYEMLAGYPPFYDETPFGIYQKILAGKYEFPKHVVPEARDLIKKLLTADRTKRLGCLRGGAADIREHPWYAKVSWEAVFSGTVPPPFVPRVKDEKDTSNFDEYPDSDEDTAAKLTPKDAELFVEFDTM